MSFKKQVDVWGKMVELIRSGHLESYSGKAANRVKFNKMRPTVTLGDDCLARLATTRRVSLTYSYGNQRIHWHNIRPSVWSSQQQDYYSPVL